jgi:hypothetical protein
VSLSHPVSQVGRDMGTPDNVLYRWISRYRQAEAHGTTRAMSSMLRGAAEEAVSWKIAGCRAGHGEFTVSMIPGDGDPIPPVFHSWAVSALK